MLSLAPADLQKSPRLWRRTGRLQRENAPAALQPSGKISAILQTGGCWYSKPDGEQNTHRAADFPERSRQEICRCDTFSARSCSPRGCWMRRSPALGLETPRIQRPEDARRPEALQAPGVPGDPRDAPDDTVARRGLLRGARGLGATLHGGAGISLRGGETPATVTSPETKDDGGGHPRQSTAVAWRACRRAYGWGKK